MTAALTDAHREELTGLVHDHAAAQVARGNDPDGSWELLRSLLTLAPGTYETPGGPVTVRVYR